MGDGFGVLGLSVRFRVPCPLFVTRLTGVMSARRLTSHGFPSFPPGNRRTRNRSRGQNRPTNVKENTIKFEGDFDFESANAQFNREELDKEFKKKLNFKGVWRYAEGAFPTKECL